MGHLVSIAYPDFVRPRLIGRGASAIGVPDYRVARIVADPEFRSIQRRCLFLGLSDGARIDTFRRSNSRVLTHEQIRQTYEIPEGRAEKMLWKLRSDLANVGAADPESALFDTVVLLDDFSGSGRTYLREEPLQDDPERTVLAGKLASFWENLGDGKELSRVLNQENLRVLLVLYVATPQAVAQVQGLAPRLFEDRAERFEIITVQSLPESLVIAEGSGSAIEPLIDKYFDPSVDDDEHAQVGGASVRYGFSGCGLPLVLHHNTPNNSIYLIWAEEPSKVRALFPRVSRHRREA
jgi:hypothetical protein